MVCVMCMWGVGIALLQVVPLFAIWYVISLPEIPMCSVTFCIVVLSLLHRIWWTMVDTSSFFCNDYPGMRGGKRDS